MFRMKSLVLTGVVVYGIFLLFLHRTFMSGQKEAQDDALVHALLRDNAHLFKGSPHILLAQQNRAILAMDSGILQNSFNFGLQVNITGDLTSVEALRNFSSHPIVVDWSALMRSLVPEGLLEQIRPGDTSLSVISRLEESPRLIRYPPFNLTLPNLESDADVKLFMLNRENREAVGLQDGQKLLGKIGILHDATIRYETDCGYKTSDGDFHPTDLSFQRDEFILKGAVIPLFVPDSHAFQHFIDGLLPKLMQVLDLALLPGVQILIFYPRDQIILEMLDALGLHKQKIIFYPNFPLHLKTMINTCITPPLHPVLWGTARSLLKVPDHLPPPKDSLVILLTRAGSYNPGRNMLNIHDVKNMLRLRYRSRLVVFKGGLNLKQTRAMFGRAAIILGVHGGALYNLMFAPPTTHIIELIPIDSQGNPLPGTAHQIFWMQSQLIGQPYWRLQLPPHTAGDVHVPISNLTAVLDMVDLALKTRALLQPINQKI